MIEPSAKQMARLQQLTPEGVAATAQVNDDDLEAIATIDTSKAYSSNGAFTDRVRSDNFVRALVNKQTGTVSYQIYQMVRYNGEARHFTSANLSTPAGLLTAPVQRISLTVIACFSSLCTYQEDVGFVVPEDTLRSIVASYRAGASTPWRFKLKSPVFDWEDRLMPAKVAGLMRAVEKFMEARARQ